MHRPHARNHRSTRRGGPAGRVRRAFTLVEIIVVVTIIALLAALVAPRLLGQLGQAKVKIAKARASMIANALTTYMVDQGLSSVPDDMELSVLALSPDDGGGRNGPYVQKREELLDPWDRPYLIRVPGVKNFDFDILSYGEDGQEGGTGAAEDITN